MNKHFSNSLKGMAMGIAEVIPGVSGGTIAFITGIYEQLIDSIKAFGPGLLPAWKDGGVKGVWDSINGTFLVSLMVGMVTGVVAGVFVIHSLLETHPEPVWSFFFGLILASSIYIAKQISKWDIKTIGALLIGIAIALYVTLVAPVNGSTSYWYIFLSAMLAISALILPGISGSFVLLLLGMYTFVTGTLKSFLSTFSMDDLKVIIVFGLGAVVGLAGFSRVLSWMFEKYKEVTFALITGFMLGSLNKIWPWRNTSTILDKKSDQMQDVTDVSAFLQLDPETYKIISETNVLPSGYLMSDPKVLLVSLALIAGFLIVYLPERLMTKSPKTTH